jgi:hypothetical protein
MGQTTPTDQVFYGTPINAAKSQIWVALSIYLLVVIAKKKLNLPCQLYTFLQIPDSPPDNQLNLFRY